MEEGGKLFGLNPITVGWLASVVVLLIVDWLRGK